MVNNKDNRIEDLWHELKFYLESKVKLRNNLVYVSELRD